MIEVTTFRLREGVSQDQFRLSDERQQMEFFYQQPGLIRRTTAVTDDGKWVTITHWDSTDEAAIAVKKGLAASVCIEAAEMIDTSTIHSDLFSTI
jgi:hypothetical protein